MKLKLGEPQVITQGIIYEENEWGYYQFPQIFNYNGTLFAKVHVAADDWDSFNSDNNLWFVSNDEGKTWEKTTSDVCAKCGTLLPNGDRIFFHEVSGMDMYNMKQPDRDMWTLIPSDKKVPAQEGCLPIMSGYKISPKYPMQFRMYDFDLMPESIQKTKFFTVDRLKKGETKCVREHASIDWKHMIYDITWIDIEKRAFNLGVYPSGGEIKVAPDNTIWMTMHRDGDLDENTGACSQFSAVSLLVSEDNGKSWKLRSKVKYTPDTDEYENAYFVGGYNESAFEFMDDGTVIMLLRTNDVSSGDRDWTPMYYTYSKDNGYSWAKPKRFDDIGVLPHLCKLKCGTTLAIYGRPGIFVRATNDKSGLKWDDRVEVMTSDDRSSLANRQNKIKSIHDWAGSCCNCDIVPIADNKAVIIYSDFYYPDKDGVKRKTILTQTVTVE